MTSRGSGCWRERQSAVTTITRIAAEKQLVEKQSLNVTVSTTTRFVASALLNTRTVAGTADRGLTESDCKAKVKTI